jgi:hypothetical protein
MVQQFPRYLPTAFDEGMTLLEKVNKIIISLNQIGKLSNDVLDQWNQVMDWVMADGLAESINEKLDAMYSDGSLAKIINIDILNQKADQTTVDALSQTLTDLVNTTIASLTASVNSTVDNVNKMMVNLESFPIQAGELDDTARFQRALNSIPTGGTIIVSKDITIGSVTIASNNTTILLNAATITTPNITFQGDNSGILGINGTLKGVLKAAKLTQDTPNGSSFLVFGGGHNFVVGDKLYSSFGLYNYTAGSYLPVTITAINGNNVTVSGSSNAVLPSGSYVGTFDWLSTLILVGNNNFAKGIKIINSQGYGFELLNKSATLEDITVDNNGLDICRIADGVTAKLKNVTFGYSYEPAKQAISTSNFADILLEDCIFNRNNSDPEFYIYGNHTGTKIKAVNCKFIGTMGSQNHMYPFNTLPPAVVSFSCNGGSTIESVELIDCEFTDYTQGAVHRPQTPDYASNIFVGKILVKGCKYTRCLMGAVAYITCTNYRIEDCEIDSQNAFTNASEFVGNTSSTIVQFFRNNISNDKTNTIFTYCIFEENTFNNNQTFNFDYSCKGYRNVFVNSPISAYPMGEDNPQLRFFDSIIEYPNFLSTPKGSIVNIGYGDTFPFRLRQGTLKGYFINNGSVDYVLEMEVPSNGLKKGLYGDDCFIPLNSLVNVLNAATVADRFKMTTKAGGTVLTNTINSGSTTVTLNGVYSMAVGDYLNIRMDDNRIHTTTITAVNGNTLTFADAIPHQASANNNAASFLY